MYIPSCCFRFSTSRYIVNAFDITVIYFVLDSPLRDKLSMAILNLQEGGRIQVLYNKWWKSTGKCLRDDNKETKANALGVQNVGGIFVVLCVGLALAVFVAIIEFIWKSKQNAQEDRVRDNFFKYKVFFVNVVHHCIKYYFTIIKPMGFNTSVLS